MHLEPPLACQEVIGFAVYRIFGMRKSPAHLFESIGPNEPEGELVGHMIVLSYTFYCFFPIEPSARVNRNNARYCVPVARSSLMSASEDLNTFYCNRSRDPRVCYQTFEGQKINPNQLKCTLRVVERNRHFLMSIVEVRSLGSSYFRRSGDRSP